MKGDRLRSEMYDKVNYMCRRYMDRMVHFAIDYDFLIDETAFKKTMHAMYEATPVLHSAFIDNHIRPYWKVCDYNINDVVQVIHSDDIERDTEAFHMQTIPLESNIQFKVTLIYSGNSTRIALVWNHMCMDGGGFTQLFEQFCRNYTKGDGMTFPGGSRSYKEVYRDLTPEDRKQAKRLFTNNSARCKHPLPFTKASDSDKPMLIRRDINPEVFEKARNRARRLGASVNDLLAAAYIDAIYNITENPSDKPFSLSCAVDLRRHLKSLNGIGATNHVAFMKCTVPKQGNTAAETLQYVAKSNAENKQDRFLGLHGLPLLDFAYSSMVYAQAELVVGAFYNNAKLSLSNMGAIRPGTYTLDGHDPVYGYVIGAVKRKPCAAMNAICFGSRLVYSMAVKGNSEDRKTVERTFDLIEKYIAELASEVDYE